jgi:hypothetical protein
MDRRKNTGTRLKRPRSGFIGEEKQPKLVVHHRAPLPLTAGHHGRRRWEEERPETATEKEIKWGNATEGQTPQGQDQKLSSETSYSLRLEI